MSLFCCSLKINILRRKLNKSVWITLKPTSSNIKTLLPLTVENTEPIEHFIIVGKIKFQQGQEILLLLHYKFY